MIKLKRVNQVSAKLFPFQSTILNTNWGTVVSAKFLLMYVSEFYVIHMYFNWLDCHFGYILIKITK